MDSVSSWYGIDLDENDSLHALPRLTMRSLSTEEAWGPSQWMHYMQGQPVSEMLRQSMLHLAWTIALHYQQEDAQQALEWLLWWETLHHARPEYSKCTGTDEYTFVTRLNYVPVHREEEYALWYNVLAIRTREKLACGESIADFVPFLAYLPWIDAITSSCEEAPNAIDHAIDQTFNDIHPAISYAQLQWVSWTMRNRHPTHAYDKSSLLHRLFNEHSLAQFSCYWHSSNSISRSNGASYPDILLPEDIPLPWRRPLFAASDITEDLPDWLNTWIEAIGHEKWAKRLSFWVAMVRVKRTGRNPPWLAHIKENHSCEWHFFENTHNWMVQFPMYSEPVLTEHNKKHFHACTLDYEFSFARQLWCMFNHEEQIEILSLPLLDD